MVTALGDHRYPDAGRGKAREKREQEGEVFEGLGEKFTRKDFLALAKNFSIADRTADKYIREFCSKGLIVREQTNEYMKITGQ